MSVDRLSSPQPPERRPALETRTDLLDVLTALEAVEWREVPEVDVDEVAAFYQRLERADDQLAAEARGES